MRATTKRPEPTRGRKMPLSCLLYLATRGRPKSTGCFIGGRVARSLGARLFHDQGVTGLWVEPLGRDGGVAHGGVHPRSGAYNVVGEVAGGKGDARKRAIGGRADC